MDHVPYPSSSPLPPIGLPFLCQDRKDTPIEKNNRPCAAADVGRANARVQKQGENERNDTISTSAPDEESVSPNLLHSGIRLPDVLVRDSVSDWTVEFWRYPERQGWRAASYESWLAPCQQETARRAQEWLYFELLQKFLSEPIEAIRFSRPGRHSKAKVLHSSLLPELLTRWTARQLRPGGSVQSYLGTIGKKPEKDSSVLSLLARVAAECNSLDDLPEPSPSTALAIRILVETLANAVYKVARVPVTGTRLTPKLGANPLLQQRFLRNGWCPRQIALLSGRYSPTTTYYLSSLPRPSTFGGVKHYSCDESRCTSASVDPATYEHQHADGCSTETHACRMVGVSSARIAECVRDGHIPLIRFEESADGILQPQVIDSHSDLRYVALSHVWSGGLGNVKANSMFSCQLRKIYDLLRTIRENGHDDLDRDKGPRKFQGSKRDVREVLGIRVLEQPILLWIDTLCVPVGYEAMRQRAIAQMAQIYVQAQCVLVLDPELQHMNLQGLPREQVFASVLCSAWNSRSWTLQEACMARVFYVQFVDGYYVLDQEWHDFMKGLTSISESGSTDGNVRNFGREVLDSLMFEVSDWFREMPVMTKIRGYDARTLMTKSEDWQNFARVWNALRTRSTTKTDDLYGIIAIMVDLSAYEILKLDPKERMKAILRSQSSLPISLLYQDCAKLTDKEGTRSWAPSEITGEHLDLRTGFMSLQDDGLLIDCHKPGATQHIWPSAYLFSTDCLVPSYLGLHVPDLETSFSFHVCWSCEVKDRAKRGVWIVLIRNVSDYQQPLQTVSGILLSVQRTQDSRFETTYVSPIQLLSGNPSSSTGKASLECAVPVSMHLVEAKSVSLSNHSIKILSGMFSSKIGLYTLCPANVVDQI
ncbi:MAG: hypothetical protein Q9218_006299 [Villophora microphyllina]